MEYRLCFEYHFVTGCDRLNDQVAKVVFDGLEGRED